LNGAVAVIVAALIKAFREVISMTAQQAIERANGFKQGNTATGEQKLEWLTEIDGMVYEEVILEHIHPLPIEAEQADGGAWLTDSGCLRPRPYTHPTIPAQS
jgi:hypothetical protein